MVRGGKGYGDRETHGEGRRHVRASLNPQGCLSLILSHRFRWVYCQLEVLRYCFPANVRRTLEELPKSLDETYERILKEINNANREHSYRLLQCLTVASRPLRVEGLAELLAIELNAGGIPKLNTDLRWEDQEEAVLSVCSSLVTVIIDDGSRVVQFSHFSVKEFLTSPRLAYCTEEVSRFHIPIEPSHMVLAQACLGALLCLDEDKDSVKKVPLVRYAAEYWVEHAKVGNVEMRIKDAMDYFFDMDKPYFPAWAGIYDVDKLNWPDRLIVKNPHHVNAQAGPYGTPLHAALFNGHIKVAQLLRERGADVNALGAYERTPLHFVSEFAAAEWLLDCGADINSRDEFGSTPLYRVASRGYLEIVRLLLEHNAEVNAQNIHGYTSLIMASSNGYRDVVRYFLDQNADASVRNDSGDTALHRAAQYGRLEVSRMLLDCNVEVNLQNDEGLTPLHRASEGSLDDDPGPWARGHIDVVQLLLEHGADAQLRNLSGKTASEVARGPEKQEIIRLLSQHAA
ncbi:ankyrin repeat-containing domain protein [Lactarius hatsudake]|nr:ankyrin repeat-containing domain protein [Lactarius hatsudake]